MPNYDNTEKNLSRAFAMERPAGFWSRPLLMPSAEALDVALGYERGLFHPSRTIIDAVEDNSYGRTYYAQMCETLAKNGFNNVRTHCQTISKMVLFHSYDLIWLDLCGELSHDIGVWLRDMAVPRLMNGATLSLTTPAGIRGSKINPKSMMGIAHRRIRTDWAEDFAQFCATHPMLQNRPYEVDVAVQLYLVERRILRGQFDPGLVLHYRHTHSMNVFRWDNIRTGLNPVTTGDILPLTDSVVTSERSTPTMSTAKKSSSSTARSRSQAAFKANVTRKHTAIQERLARGEISPGSARALKANVTMAARRAGMIG